MLAMLSEKEMCAMDIREKACIAYSHSVNYLSYLLGKKLIYISSWKLEKHGKRTMHWPYYKAGSKKSKPKPENLSNAEKSKRYREKLKKDVHKVSIQNAKRRNKRIKVKPDWTAAWIMQSSSSGQ